MSSDMYLANIMHTCHFQVIGR